MEQSDGFLIVVAGAGLKVIVEFVIINGYGAGTRLSGSWTVTSLSTLLTTQVISVRSLSDSVFKWWIACDCCCMSVSRF